MDIKAKLSSVGYTLLGICAFIAVIAIPIILVKGALIIAPVVLPKIAHFSQYLFVFNLLVLLPMCLFKRLRPWAGLGFVGSSYVFGLLLWILGLLITWSLWGGFAVIIGLFFLGVGVVPFAILASLFKGMWPILFNLILMLLLVFGLRFLGAYLVSREEPV